MKVWIPLVALAVALLVAACGSLAFTVANAPALFGDFSRKANLAYGALDRQRLDVYSPKHARGAPVIVFWHGGSWENGDKSKYRFVGVALAEAGYVAVLPNYQLYPQVRFPVFVDDGAQALAWVVSQVEKYGGDPSRVYLAGHSAGAHLAGMVAYDPGRLSTAGIPAGTIRGFIGLSGPYALDPDTDILRTIFSAPYTQADWQPTQLARAGAPPALLLHVDADDVVDVRHSRLMAEALTRAGVAVNLTVYAGGKHRDTVAAFATLAPHKLPVLEEIRRFTAQH